MPNGTIGKKVPYSQVTPDLHKRALATDATVVATPAARRVWCDSLERQAFLRSPKQRNRIMNYPYEPDYSVPVWDTIKEMMEDCGMDQEDVAIAMCEEPVTERAYAENYLVLDFIRLAGEDPRLLTSDSTTAGLERAFGVPASFWRKRFDSHRQFLIAASN